MKHLLYTTLFLFVFSTLKGQDFQSQDIVVFPGEFNSHEVFQTDVMGNKIYAGSASGSINFDLHGGTENLPETSHKDLYLVKYDADQNIQWLHALDGSDTTNQIRAMVLDDAGNIYIAGAFTGQLHLSNDGLNEVTNDGEQNFFVAKYDPMGNLLWQFDAGDSDSEQYPDALFIQNNRLIVQLVYKGTFDVDPGPDVTNLMGNSNAMLVYDLDGNLIDAHSHRGQTNINTSAFDHEGNLYIGGLFSGLATFDYKSNASVFAIGLFDAYVAKYDSDFNLLWFERIIKGDETLSFTNIAINSEGAIKAIGIFADGTIVDGVTAENDAIYMLDISSDGDFSNLTEILPRTCTVEDLLINSVDQILLTSSFREVLDIDPSAEFRELTPMADHDNCLLAVFEPDFSLAGASTIYAPTINTKSAYLDGEDQLDILIDFTGMGKVVYDRTEDYNSGAEESFIHYKLNTGGCASSEESISLESCTDIVVNNETITTSGDYTQILINELGCDSILNLSITIYPNYNINQNVESCGPFEADGNTFSESGVYTLDLQSEDGCDSIVLLNLTVIDIDKSISLSNNTITANDVEADAYQWYDCDSDEAIIGATENSYTPLEDGSYRVEISKNGCIEFSDCIEFSIVSTEDLILEFGISPNPSTGLFSIEIEQMTGNYSVTVFEPTGKEVARFIHANGYTDLSRLSQGLYILKIEKEGRIGLKKIIIQ